ncbi:MAG: YtxH domain-containing protein [Candidatus Gastranaerophilales bacterium]|nr:YtxH domain-containing protein [Candidatus Gastranaerophilales bacterium]
MSKDDDALIFGIGILAGVTAGIIAGLLMAPASGEETRKKLENHVNDFAENCCPTLEEAKRQALATVDVLQFKIEKAIKKVNDMIKARQLAKAKDKEHSVYGI